VERYVERLFAAQGLVLCFPVWCFGPPAILKGFIDRVMVPGVSFKLDEHGVLRPNLTHIRRLAAVTTDGRKRAEMWWLVLLCHKFSFSFTLPQHGQRGTLLRR
jgi:putative NADPH-quinone reductase